MAPARAVLSLFVALALTLSVVVTPAWAKGKVTLSASPKQPIVGKAFTLTASVTPKARGRKVLFQHWNGKKWVTKSTSKTSRSGMASAKVTLKVVGKQRLRAVAKPHKGQSQRTDELNVTVQKAATEVTADWSPGPWDVAEQVGVPVTVAPGAPGRQVWLERKNGGAWSAVSDPAGTNSSGRAVVTWLPDAPGVSDYRVVVAASATHEAAATAPVSREVLADNAALRVTAPEWVLAGDQLEMLVEVGSEEFAIDDGVVSLTAPEEGEQVTPPNDFDVDDVLHTAQVDVGDVAEGETVVLRLRWRAPAEATTLAVSASLTSAGPTEEADAETDVLAALGSGGSFGGGMEMYRESTWAPDHESQIFQFCDQVPNVPVPSFAAAKAAALAYLESVMVEDHADEWEAEAALDDPALIDQVVLIALADDRPAAALAAALRGAELAPNDAVHLSNAAVAAISLQHPEWAIAFTREAALAGPAPSVGAPQEAIRLATEAHAWALMRDWAKAESAMRGALMVDPDNPQLHAQMGAFLACQGDKAGALSFVRRGLRPTDAEDTMKTDEDRPEEDRMTWLGASDLYDLSGGTEDELTTPTLPADWAELYGRGRLEGNGYYEDEYDRLFDRFIELAQKRSQLQGQLNAAMQGASPAWRQRTDDILMRISSAGDLEVQEAWDAYVEVQGKAISLNNCEPGLFSSHPFCNPDSPTDFSCATDEAVFSEWLHRMQDWESALNDYHEVAWPVFTGLQANLADPTAHELAGVMVEMHFLSDGLMAYAQNLTGTADQFTFYNQDGDPEEDDRDCITQAAPPDGETSEAGGDEPGPCAPGSIESKLSIKLDLGIMAFSFDCEKAAVEVGLGAYGFLEAFARVEQKWGENTAATYYVGSQVGVPFIGSYESALYLETDNNGLIKDLGIESGVSSSAGYVIEVDLGSDKQRVSAMSMFTAR